MEPIEDPSGVADFTREIASEDAALQRYVQSFAPSATEAQDVVQETWLAALEGEAPRLWRNPQAWLRVVARRIVHRDRARRALRAKSERAAALGARERSGLANLELEREAALQAVAELEEPYRTVIRLRFFAELSTEEIARQLERSPATVRSQIHRGIALVRERMSPRQRAERRWLLLGWLRPARGAGTGRPGLTSALRALLAVGLVVVSLWFGLRRVEQSERAPAEELVLAASLAEPEPEDRSPVQVPADATRTSTRSRQTFESTALAAAAVAPVVPADAAPSLEIEVVDPLGNPVPGALVSVVLRSSSDPRGTSDERGRCRIELSAADAGAYVLPATLGRVTLQASSADHAASSLIHVPFELCDGRMLDIALGGPPLELTGRVVDEAGRAVPDAQVSCGGAGGFIPPAGEIVFESPWMPETRTDEQGAFTLAGLERAPQFVRVFTDGFLERRERVAPPPTCTDGLDCTLVLRRGGMLSGRVDGSDGQPVTGALVFVEPLTRPTEWSARLAGYDERLIGFAAQVVTDENGRFELSGIRPGKRRVWAIGASEVATVVLTLDALQPSTWEARLAPASGLALRVVDEQGKPCAGLRVRLRSGMENDPHEWMRSVTTDEDGCVRVADCVDGPTSVEILDPRMVELLARATYLHPGSEEHVIVVRERASSAGIVRGVLLGHDGLPITSASLKRYDRESQTAIALSLDRSTGHFEQAFPPGRFVLACVVDRRGFSFGEHALEAGETLDLGVLTAPETGTLVPLAGAAPPLAVQPQSFRLSVRYPTDGPSIFRELLRGSWPPPEEIELFPGTHWIEAIDEATGVVFRAEAEIRSGATAWMDLP